MMREVKAEVIPVIIENVIHKIEKWIQQIW